MPTSDQHSPASGERRAARGLQAQYRFAAGRIYAALRQGALEWIAVTDPRAGRVDDVQLATRERIDAYQVKWSTPPGTLSFRDITHSQDDQASLVEQLSDGWQRLRAANPGVRVVVHLATSDRASTHDRIALSESKSGTFAAFLHEAWERRSAPRPDSSKWSQAWDYLRQASRLDEPSFGLFLRDCELDLDCRDPEEVFSDQPEARQALEDVQHLATNLMGIAAMVPPRVRWSRSELLDHLGWRLRTSLRVGQNFPIDREVYEPISPTLDDLDEATSRTDGGYLILTGSPGSGKSTLLTDWATRRSERVIRYYAFIPDGTSPEDIRGESSTFLHDLVLQIDRAGFPYGPALPAFDRAALTRALRAQLDLLHRDYLERGIKTILLIDGLDHVPRDLKPASTFLRDLPSPQLLRPGVLILLGTQTDRLEDMPSSVAAQLRDSNRRVEISSLGRAAVDTILARTLTNLNIDADARKTIFSATGGHPLALAYFVQELRTKESTADVSEFLREQHEFPGTIDLYYDSYWQRLQSDDDLTHLLGLVARVRGAIEPLWLSSWAGPATVRRFTRLLSHLFDRASDERWYFFHNSFRVFLRQKTAELAPGEHSEELDRRLHGELARQYLASPEDSNHRWDSVFHLIHSGDAHAALSEASVEALRNQLASLRPLHLIRADCALLLRAAAAEENIVETARWLLADAEFSQREWSLDTSELQDTLYLVAPIEILEDNARDGSRLLLSEREALDLATLLCNRGYERPARKLLLLAEPTSLVYSGISTDNPELNSEIQTLESWARLSIRFRPVPRVRDSLRALRFQPIDDLRGRGFGVEATGENLRLIQNRIIRAAAITLIESNRSADLDDLMSGLDPDQPADAELELAVTLDRWYQQRRTGGAEDTETLIRTALQRVGPDTPDQLLLLLAEACALQDSSDERARVLAARVDVPELGDGPTAQYDSHTPAARRFRLARLQFYFGNPGAARELVPEPSSERDQCLYEFERNLVEVARLHAGAWAGRHLSTGSVRQLCVPLLRFFARQDMFRTSWYRVRGARAGFCRFLARAVAQHGASALEELQRVLSDEWSDAATRPYWDPATIREVVNEILDLGGGRDWALEQVRSIEEALVAGADVAGRIENRLSHACVLFRLGERADATHFVREALLGSFGVGYRKDYQLDTWIVWFMRLTAGDDSLTSDRLAWMASAIASLDESTEGRVTHSAIDELLDALTPVSPTSAFELVKWFVAVGAGRLQRCLGDLLSAGARLSREPEVLAAAIADLLIPISEDGDASRAVPREAVLATASGTSRASADSLRDAIAHSVMCAAVRTGRYEWARGLVEGCERAGIALPEIDIDHLVLPRSARDSSSHSNTLKLEGGGELDEDAVRARVSGPSELTELIRSESSDSYFSWPKIVKDICSAWNGAELRNAADAFSGHSYAADTLACLAELALALGEASVAKSISQSAIEWSNSTDWARSLGSGARLKALKVIAELDYSEARRIVFDLLAEDTTSDRWYPSSVAMELEAIVNIAEQGAPPPELAEVVWDHIQSLFHGVEFDLAPPTSMLRQDERTFDEELGRLIVSLIAHPCGIVMGSAISAVIRVLRQTELLDPPLRESLARGSEHQERAIECISAASGESSDVATRFASELEIAVQEENLQTSSVAQRLVVGLGLPVDSSPAHLELPALLRFELPPDPPREDRVLAEGWIPLAPFELWIDALASATGIPRQNIVAELVRRAKAAPEHSGDFEREGRELQRHLSSAGLRFPFVRPRVAALRLALLELAGNLMRCGVVDPSRADSLRVFFRFGDEALWRLCPAIRPSEVPELSKKQQPYPRFDYGEEWLARCSAEFESVFTSSIGAYLVIAEETQVKGLTWELPEETRCRAIRPESAPAACDEPERFFPMVVNTLLVEYGALADVPEQSIVIRQSAPTFEAQSKGWLAFSPTLARSLDWRLDSEGLFRWVDSDGAVMAESVWWTDGFIDHQPPDSDCEVGAGWLVLATRDAIQAVMNAMGPLSLDGLLTRAYREDRAERESRHVATVSTANVVGFEFLGP